MIGYFLRNHTKKFESAQKVIRRHKSKNDGKYNEQMKDKKRNNIPQNTTQKSKE
jgi:hypothetical protein